ncbi:TRAP transporter small permease [Paracoccus seriniphilus]|uniref:TRAP transporter small permease protein n=1 Tax=Paracoccus seriniphilus TaxID=184748 RepID=A0A239Q2V2_9RHOB|nr:TRAP transporter small permease [Paracoccus seriniphilus]WCR15622.1 TRAP transporter small permease [Paracoccus seriniphilus]SNT76648.1 TRAP-type C4-dicarboxylate transport system, small permease component [Paracoccus seriniphilus]
MQKTDKLLRAIIAVYGGIGAVIIFLMMLHITADVISKFVFNQPLPGTIQIVSQYYMVAAAFLPLAMVERLTGHISVEILYNVLPGTLRGILAMFSTALGAVVFAAMAWASWGEAVKKYTIGSFSYEQGVKIAIWPSYFILPAGTALLALVFLWRLIAYVMRAEDPSALTPGQAQASSEGVSID